MNGVETSETADVSTYTLAAASSPLAGTPLFSEVFETSVTVNWASGTVTGGFSGPGATFLVQASTRASFIPVAGSSLTGNIFAAVPNLFANATHYFRVRAYNTLGAPNDWFVLGATVTAIETPATVYVDEVTSHSIVAAAYAPAFSSMTAGPSGTNVSLGGNYQGWHGEKWTAKAAMSTPRDFVAVAALGGKVYAVGGQNGGFLATAEAWDPVANSWSALPSISVARARMAGAAAGGRVYVLGGYSGSVYATTEAYDPVSGVWTVLTPMPAARHDFAAVAFEGKIYGFGGTVGSGYMNRTEVYDPAADAWTVKTVMPTARQSMVAGVVRGKIYLVGGHNGTPIATNEAYDPATDGWTSLPPAPTPRAEPGGGAVGGKVYVLAGENTPPYTVNEVYDPFTNAWTTGAAMPSPRNNMGSAVMGGRIYLAGGFVGGSPSTSFDEYDPGTASSFTALTPNTLYSFKAKARNSAGVETAESVAVTTYTLAAATVPQAGAPVFSAVFASSLTVSWSSGTDAGGYNGAGATYLVQAATKASFTPVAASSLTANPYAQLPGLFPNATHYFRVRAYNTTGAPNDWFVLGATMTDIEAPTTVYIDEVTTHSIVAAAYAGGPAFSSMTVGLSGTNVALAGVYQGWHGERWTTKAAGTPLRQAAGAAAVGGKVHVVGGYNGSHLTTHEAYDPVTGAWEARAAMPTGRERLGLALLGGKLYAVGGSHASIEGLNLNEAYDPASDAWSARASMSTGRQGPAVVAVGGAVYAFGGCPSGCGASAGLNTVERYDPAADAWTPRASMTTAREGASAGVVGGRVYVVGGHNGSALTANEEYDPLGDSWATKAVMPAPRSFHATAALGGKVYALGGFVAAATNVNTSYDPATDVWTSRAPLPTTRTLPAAAASGGRIYVIGGWSGAAFLNANEEYDPGTASSFTALTPNTQYFFKAKARNSEGRETAESLTVSTYTLAFATFPAGQVFTALYSSAVAVAWSGPGNGPGASYLVEASTMATFAPVAGSSTTFNLSAEVGGLAANATNHFRVRALNVVGSPNDWVFLGTTVTLANPAVSAASTFTMVGASSMTVEWGANGNGAGTRYEVVLASFTPSLGAPSLSTAPQGAPSATLSGLLPNATYYLTVTAYNRAGAPTAPTALGSTVTAIETPTSVYFDEVTTHSITAAAYAPTFSSMTMGLSGTNIALAGSYQGWQGESWNARAAMTTPRSQLAIGVIGGKAYAVGGTNGALLSVNEVYDPVADVWAARASAPTPRAALAVSVLEGRLHAFGGLVPGVSALNEQYDPLSDSWRTLTPMPTARHGLGAAAVGGKAYVVGGYNAGFLGTNEEYDPGTDSWATKATMTTPRYRFGTAVVNGRVYAAGGSDAGLLALNQEYDPAADTWATKAPMSAARFEVCAAAVGGKIFVFGGNDGGILGRTERYDPVADSWVPAAPMLTGRGFAAAFAVGGKAFVVGGDNGAYVATNEAYNPGVASSFTVLTPNTLYAFKAKARNSLGVETGETLGFSTYTLAAATAPLGAVFTVIDASSVTVNWAPGTAAGGFNGAGATYLVQASTLPSFISVAGASLTANTSSSMTGLYANATHYFRVRAYNSVNVPNDWYVLGATVTAIEAPTTVYFDEVTTHSIVAAAYAPAFSSMTAGVSGTN
ncbi:hypothetical protein EPO15_11930, partial [bacterium]